MEIALDIGKNIHNKLGKYADTSGETIEDFTLNMIDLGLRIHESSLVKDDDIQPQDESLQATLENNKIIKEVIKCVFDRDKITGKLYDADTLITMAENTTAAYLSGKEA
ncbi:hypothetical protein N8865_01080 [Francisellaceae bacterium]|nr:hypothetical protein [Francisellaceae bacterium]